MLERDKWYTPNEIAAALGTHPHTVRRWIRAGRLPAQQQFIGRAYKVRGADILDRLSDLERQAAEE